MAKLCEKIKDLDIYGQEYTFKYKTKEKYKTRLGAVLSIVSILIICTITVKIIENYIDTSTPGISSSTRIDQTPPKRNLYTSKFGFGVGLFVNPSSVIPVNNIPKYITPLGFVLEMNLSDLDANKITFDRVEVIQFRPCSEIEDTTLTDIFLNAEDIQVRSFIKNFLLCPDIKQPDDYFVQSNAYSTPFRIIQMTIFPCALPDPADCAPASELAVSNVNFGFTETSFKPDSKDSPLSIVPTVQDFRISVTQETRWEIKLKNTDVYDDEYDFFKRKQRFSFLQKDEESMYGIIRPAPLVHCTFEQILGLLCPPYSTLTIKSSGKTTSIVREYEKVLATLGEIGGAIEIVIFIIAFFYVFYNAYHMKKFKKKRVLNHNFDQLKAIYNQDEEEKIKIVDKVGEEVLDDREDIIRLYNNQTNWEVLQNVIFKDFHKQLFPVALLHSKFSKESQRGAGGSLLKSKTQYRKNSIRNLRLAYSKLLEHTPENDIEKKLRDYFVENIPESLKTFGNFCEIENFDAKEGKSDYNQLGKFSQQIDEERVGGFSSKVAPYRKTKKIFKKSGKTDLDRFVSGVGQSQRHKRSKSTKVLGKNMGFIG